ncbi:putative 3-mercaptopyruvate sulfurtransferase [Crenothrix polyspora]|uniref:Putative 3-mercaptopyruvate sulfurtransferase n=1 Tax=Crenothrix polyspora TaxID=360316 RepID=A0A1R4H1P3_9GAMM|nr:sulfurtransferase [Crenothrix polyspora]SJM89980.1 putative 3-mercaptopyruvate sulfurtransferase [Crenothrix polyspora]
MPFTTVISADTVLEYLEHDNWVIIDCRFSLAAPEAGISAYRLGHIPNARYAHLNNDLSSAITSLTGRHPLPDFNLLVKKIAAWGITFNNQIIVYDDAGGAFAARLWWLLRCLGHTQVAVLDGGIQQWLAKNYPMTTHLPVSTAGHFKAYLDTTQWLDTLQLENSLARKSICLIDARTPERYRGEHEPIDPVAGHIPGALNRPFQNNLTSRGLFLSPDELQQQFKLLINGMPAKQVVHTCGSGVTACHNLLAMEYAGLIGSKLYAGSWSEWIRNKNRPIATQ